MLQVQTPFGGPDPSPLVTQRFLHCCWWQWLIQLDGTQLSARKMGQAGVQFRPGAQFKPGALAGKKRKAKNPSQLISQAALCIYT